MKAAAERRTSVSWATAGDKDVPSISIVPEAPAEEVRGKKRPPDAVENNQPSSSTPTPAVEKSKATIRPPPQKRVKQATSIFIPKRNKV